MSVITAIPKILPLAPTSKAQSVFEIILSPASGYMNAIDHNQVWQ